MTTSRLLFCLWSLLGVGQASSADLAIGKPVPTISATLLDTSRKIETGPVSGKVTIVNFWATWCVPCRAEMPAIQAYYDKHKAQGLEVLAINMDDPRDLADVRKLAQSTSFPVALKADANFKGLGRIWRMPSTFVIDRNGIWRKNGHEGIPAVDLDILEAVVTPLLDMP
jgi:thiol-disulfide isomerase/thioredoxin